MSTATISRPALLPAVLANLVRPPTVPEQDDAPFLSYNFTFSIPIQSGPRGLASHPPLQAAPPLPMVHTPSPLVGESAPNVVVLPVADRSATTPPVLAPEGPVIEATPAIPSADLPDVAAMAPLQTVPAPQEPGAGIPAAESSLSEPISPVTFLPSAETLAFLNRFPNLDYDTQMVKLVTTGEVIPDLNHRQATPRLDAQPMMAVVGIRNSTTGKILGSVGGAQYVKFRPCQNAFLIESLSKAGFLERMEPITATSFHGGGISLIQLEAKDPNLIFEIDHRQAKVRFHVINGHNGSHSLTVRPMIHLQSKGSSHAGDIPMFTKAGALTESRIRHTQRLNETVSDLTKVWGLTLDKSAEAVDALRQMSTLRITGAEMRAIILSAMNRSVDPNTNNTPKSAENFMSSLNEHLMGGTPETLLDLADAVASHVDCTRPMRNRSSMSVHEYRTQSSVLGAGARLKAAVIDEAMKMLKGTPPGGF